ncbi:MAG: glycosyltransferase family 2 protein [Deltaproteobacteria bacterium]|nr:MAG: glycosyltransferase family 2 protein [Deltaproteobacteria bacterium]
MVKAMSNDKTKEFSCSIIIPCHNEVGNIEDCVEKIPKIGNHTELIFVDDASNDGTAEIIEGMIEKYKGEKDIKLIRQVPHLGKSDAVRKGFDTACGEILFIYDADLTVPPEDLPKFYQPIAEGKAEFINGSRMLYPMENQAMRMLNFLANKAFSKIFTWLLEQKITDTLCGTKVLFKKDYEKIKSERDYFGNFDPTGDFDLLFGAVHLNLRIVEIPVRYRARVHGDIKISRKRFRYGFLFLIMCFIGFRKLKVTKWHKTIKYFFKKNQNI